MKKYRLPALNYDYKDLEPAYSSELLELHYTKHHKAYVDGANKTRQELAASREARDFAHIAELQRNLAFNVSGHVLHSIFWCNIAPGENSRPAGDLAKAIKASFGSLDLFRAQLSAVGLSIQGSGWASLAWDPLSQSLVIQQIHDHHANIASGNVPILVMDMWEHAFYLQYRNEKKRWVKAFWELVNWSDVGDRLAKAGKLEMP
jgi:Fe-Mn family superoxide dismutase